MPQERKVATVLFADIVGSTAIGSAHDPEVVRRSLSRAFAEIRGALEAHGGTVEKFIGDAVMAVFGIPVTHDDDADRAVRAAFALRDRVARLNAGGRFEVEFRIGVNSGPVVTGGEGEETLVTGAPVNEAARLQQAAASGEILAGPLTHQLTTSGVAYGDRRVIEAKGIGELEAWPAEALRSDLPEQRRGLAGLQAPLIGRDDELRVLVDSYRRMTGERRAALVTVFGVAGVGKSRLVRELVDIIGAERVRRGRCLPYGEGITFWPLVEILRADIGVGATDSGEEATAKMRLAVLGAFGEAEGDSDAIARRLAVVMGLARPEETMPDVAADAIQQELRWGLRRYFERRAEREPLTVVFDDIHWAEPALLDLIEHVAEWARAPLFLVCLARPDLRERRAGWGGGLMNAASIRLEPLTADESRRLVRELLRIDALPEGLRSEVVARAGGNPLYLEEFLRMLIDAGHIAQRDGRWVANESVATLVVPPTLQALISARLDQMPADMKRVIQRAAVVGKVFWPDAIVAQGGVPGRVDDVLLDAARRDLVAELDERGIGGGRAYSFRHILIRDVAYDGIPKEERARLHDAFGRWLEDAAAERAEEYADIVAYHAEQAFRFADEIGDEEGLAALGARAFASLLAAGRKSWRRRDLRATHSFYARAAEIAERIVVRDPERIEALVYAAVGQHAAEGSAASLESLKRATGTARGAGPSVALVDALLEVASATLQDSLERGAELFEEALAAARQVGEPELIARALLSRHITHWWRGDLEQDRRMLLEADAYVRDHGLTREAPEVLIWLAANHAESGEISRSEPYRKEHARLGETHGSFKVRREVKLGEMHIALFRGEPTAAVAAARAGLALANEMGIREEVGRANEQIGETLFEAGDPTGSRDALLEALRWYDPATMRGAIPETEWRLARAYLALGDIAAARQHAEAGRASVSETDVYSVTMTTNALARVRAAEGRYTEAEALFGDALVRAGGSAYRRIQADVMRDTGEFLLERGRTTEARAMLERALAIHSDPIAAGPRRKIEDLLRRCGEVRV